MQATEAQPTIERRSWFDRPLLSAVTLNLETAIFIVILIAAVFTRFYMLGTRVMSHDETSHVYFSWLLYEGNGYQHDPITHGPLQFHLLALSYFLFGDSDFSGRVPAAIFSLATVALVWAFRRYLGRAGTLIAAVMMVISPYILYYGRYARNEAFVGVFGLVMLWATLRYIETGRHRYLYFLTASIALHVTTKETSYIYVAQLLLFLGLYFIYQVTKKPWVRPNLRNYFLEAVIAAIGFLGVGLGLTLGTKTPENISAPSALAPETAQILHTIGLVLAGIGAIAFVAALVFLWLGYTLPKLQRERSFNLITLVWFIHLPLLSAFVVNQLGFHVPVNATEVNALVATDILVIGLVVLGVVALSLIGLFLFPKRGLWAKNALLFWGIFIFFYSTMFTHGAGIATGLIGSLGYWLEQQGVQRGEQPWYYYGLIQVPVYEYLPALGVIAAGILALLGKRAGGRIEADELDEPAPNDVEVMVAALPEISPDIPMAAADEGEPPAVKVDEPERPPVLSLLGFWSVSSLFAYSYAGEKMPWLTFHITLGAILLAGWAFGQLVETVNWRQMLEKRGAVVLALIPVFLLSLSASIGSLLGGSPPFQGKDLQQLADTSTFLVSFIIAVISGGSLLYLIAGWKFGQTLSLFAVVFFGLLAVLTLRTTITANFISYDDANELLVYAHSGPGVKTVLSQIEDISKRTTNGLDIVVAYDNETSYPYWWYLRDYHNYVYYGQDPTRDLRRAAVILVGDANYGKLEPIVREEYYPFEYIRMWWPNQDYFNLTWERIRDALTNPAMRSALWQIWLNRDYTEYGTAIGQDITLAQWNPSAKMRMYIRKDIAAQLWNYGAAPGEPVVDPYEGKAIQLAADIMLGSQGNAEGQFLNPRDVAVAPDGTLYISDAGNNRIQHLDRDGTVLAAWGTYGSIQNGSTPAGGQFDQPWGIAVGDDGSVYVADLWNHRIQKFTAEGEFVTMWGVFGQAENGFALWGPRDIAIDGQGNLYVTDTGNKRVVVYDPDGNFITEFGREGFELGQFYEPVGLDWDAEGNLYVADTWNQRVQKFIPDDNPVGLVAGSAWDISGWYGETLDNKPYLAVDDETGNVFVTDPEGYRVIQFSPTGEIISYWGDYGSDSATFGIINGIAYDPTSGGVWVVDSGTGRILHFTPQTP